MALLVLVGSNLAQAQGLVASYLLTDQFPNTDLFRIVFWFVWFPLVVLTAWCGLAGGYLALRRGSLATSYLTAFAFLLCPIVKVDHRELGWAGYGLSVFLGLDRFAVGCNFVGVAFLVWLDRVRALEGPPVVSSHPTGGTESRIL